MTTAGHERAHVRDEPASGGLNRGTLVAALLAVCVGQVALAIPAVLNGLFQTDLGTSASQLTWISDAFLVPVTLLELTFGVLGDLFGRKRLLLIGSGLIVVGELVGTLTPGASASTGTRALVLWIGQGLAGVGAAALFPTTLAMIAAGTHTARERGRAIGLWAAALSAGNVVSPVAGGLVVRLQFGSDPNAGWRWAFILVIALGLISFLVSLLCARDSKAPEGRSLDWPGQITIAVSLFGLLFAIIQAPTAGWGSAEVVIGFIVAVIFFALFIVVERRTTAPLLRLDLFAERSFAVIALVTVSGMFAMLGTAYATSVRLSSIQGFSPLKTSIAFLLLNGVTVAQVPLTIRMLPRINPRWMLSGGFALIALGDFWLSAQTATDASLWPVVPGLALVGLGFALAVSSVTAAAVNAVPDGLEGMASAATNTLRDFGFTLGPAIVGAVALGRAGSIITAKVSASPALQKALTAFYASPSHAPAAERSKVAAAVQAVRSGPLGQHAVPATVPGPGGHPMPFNPLHTIAFHALDHAYNIGYFVCGAAAAVSFLLAAVALGGLQRPQEPVRDSARGARVSERSAV
jgi:MFS family permease